MVDPIVPAGSFYFRETLPISPMKIGFSKRRSCWKNSKKIPASETETGFTAIYMYNHNSKLMS